MLEFIDKVIQHPEKVIINLGKRELLNWMPDELYLKIVYGLIFKKKLDLDNPKTFSEKLQWLKIHDRQPKYTTMVDKCEAKKYAATKIGEEYIIPTLGVWDNFDDIDFDKLPDQFVLKCTHDSGGLVICKDKSNFDAHSAKKKISQCLSRNYYWLGREWPYINVRPRIIAEKYMADKSSLELKDNKIFNFDGGPRLIQVDYDCFIEHKRKLYTTDWQYVEAIIQYPTSGEHQIARTRRFEKIVEIARMLAAGIPNIRTKFYCIDNKIYFGELTFYHESAFSRFTPESFGEEMGKWLKLPGGGYALNNEYGVFVLREKKMITIQN